MKNDDGLAQIAKKLDVVITLLADIAASRESRTISGKVDMLLGLGLSAGEVGRIIGKPTNYVTAVAHQKRKTTKKVKRNG